MAPKSDNIKFMKVRNNKASGTVQIPWGIFESAESKEELEDWLMANDPQFIQRMRQARHEDMEGKCRPIKEVARRLRMKSL